MSIGVTASKVLLASVSFIQPVTTLDYIQAQATTSYIEPLITTSYIQVQVTTEVTFPDVLNVEIITPTDLVTLDVVKVLEESTTPIDIPAFMPIKSFNDFYSLADSKILFINKQINDSTDENYTVDSTYFLQDYVYTYPKLTDAISLEPNKSIEDSFLLSDIIDTLLIYNRSFSDLTTTSESAAFLFDKLLSDTTTTNDSVITIVTFNRDFLDFTTFSDSLIFVVDLQKTDIITSTEALFFDSSKSLLETISLIESTYYEIIKVFSDLTTSSDLSTLAFSSEQADNVTTSTSGFLISQDYCDITYFLEDYVGSYRTFS